MQTGSPSTGSINAPVVVSTDPAETGAHLVSSSSRACVGRAGIFSLALSGGKTPRPLHRMLAREPYRSRIPWSHVHLFWVDERCVPTSDPASNYGQARRDFLDSVPIPGSNIHSMPVHLPAEKAARRYQRHLARFFSGAGDAFPHFDLVLLGLGKDGHTASLFPDSPHLLDTEDWVVALRGGEPEVDRLSLTLPVFNAAKTVVFLVTGEDKALILRRVFEEPGTGLPAEMVGPSSGDLLWLLDPQSAALLPEARKTGTAALGLEAPRFRENGLHPAERIGDVSE